ncbi:AfsR/SARP family transcriptional regulator [Jiangella muralis]|uniref:AfsR/SARP family transcriptional regulator n=1 Tax=Jiangella muralis TaxID=702383 RepID=UPI00069DFF5D|nr:BTAD domain-containing putative transcriptional regulator [Jiangella muralis]
MGINLLGPIELAGSELRVEVGPTRLRVVLVALALQVNRVVAVDELIDAVWESEPPTTARAQIRICISELRRMFQAAGLSAAIHTQPSGYLLDVASSGDVDALRFDGLVAGARGHVAAGDLDTAVATLRRADALWRGPVLTGVPTTFARQVALRLEDARLAAAEERIGLELELGHHEQVVGELRLLIDRHPLREGLHRELMLALYRSGRQGEALDAYQVVRRLLVEELGVEPGVELRELHRAVLERDPALDADATSIRPPADRGIPRLLPASIADFTGRETQLAALRRALVEVVPAEHFAVRIAAVSGPGGVGKSVLAIRAAHEVADHFPDGQLFADLRGAPGDGPAMRALDRFLRALGIAGTAIPDDPDERAEMYRSRLAGKRILVVLDDVADEEQARLLLPGRPGCGVMVVSRVRLAGLDGARQLDVDVLDIDGSVQLLARMTTAARVRADPVAARRLAELCAGLPLALRICAARLTARPDWTLDRLVQRLENESRRLDELAHRRLRVRSTIGISFQGLDPDAQRLFRRFALVTAPDAPAWAAAALCDASVERAVAVMDRLVDARLVTATGRQGDSDSRYRLHDVVRLYATEALAAAESDAERGAALDRLLGGWLAFADDAHRHVYGGDHTTIHGTAPRWRPPSGVMPWPGDPFPRLDQGERRGLVAAVNQAADTGLDELCWDLALTLITLYETKGYFDDWLETTRAGLGAVERTGNLLGLAAMRYSLGSLHVQRFQYDQAFEPLLQAVADFRVLGNRHGLGLALRNLTSVYRGRGEAETAVRCANEALELLRAVADPVAEAHVLVQLARLQSRSNDLAGARTLVDQALVLVREVGYRRGIAQGLDTSATIHTRAGDLELARSASLEALHLVREIDDDVGTPYVLLGLGKIEQQAGDTGLAVEHLRRAEILADGLGLAGIGNEARALLDRWPGDTAAIHDR